MQVRSRRWSTSTGPSSTRWYPCRRPQKRSSSSCSRTRFVTSTSRSSTSLRCSRVTSTSTYGTRSTPPRRNPSGTCASRPGRASVVTAYRSIPRISRGEWSVSSGIDFDSSSSPMTSIAACPNTWCAGCRQCSMSEAIRSEALGSSPLVSRTRAERRTVGSRRRSRSSSGSWRWEQRCARMTLTYRTPRGRGRRASIAASRSWRPPISCCSWWTIPTCPTTSSVSGPDSFSIRARF